MILNRYGGPWQEFRAYLATVLFGWAQSVHFAATMDLAKMLAALEAEARQDADLYARHEALAAEWAALDGSRPIASRPPGDPSRSDHKHHRLRKDGGP